MKLDIIVSTFMDVMGSNGSGLRQAHQGKSSSELSRKERLVIEAVRRIYAVCSMKVLRSCESKINPLGLEGIHGPVRRLQASKPCQHYRSSRSRKTLHP